MGTEIEVTGGTDRGIDNKFRCNPVNGTCYNGAIVVSSCIIDNLLCTSMQNALETRMQSNQFSSCCVYMFCNTGIWLYLISSGCCQVILFTCNSDLKKSFWNYKATPAMFNNTIEQDL